MAQGVPLATPASGSPSAIEIGLGQVADGLADPVGVAAPDDGSGRLFIVERHGRIRVVDASGELLDTPFLDLAPRFKQATWSRDSSVWPST